MSTLSLADSTFLHLEGGGGNSRGTHALTFPATTDRYFIQPMDLSDPAEDLLGLVQVCSFKLEELEELKRTSLNKPTRVRFMEMLPSFIVRIWSRASGRYLCILPVGAQVYARGIFGPAGQFRMLIRGKDTVVFRCATKQENHLALEDHIVVGNGKGSKESEFILHQNDDGYCTLEHKSTPGYYLGVRDNGNIMPADQVTPDSHHAHFIIQKEAFDVL